jgi:hypothetical protein
VSGEERVNERRKNFVDDVSVEALKSGDNRFAHEPIWNPLTEAYVEGRCEVHVHFRAGTVEGRIFGDWCAAIKIAESDLDFVDADAVGFKKRQSGKVVQGNDVRKPVLVYGLKPIKLPQGITTEPVPSLVRLQSLDHCLGEWVDAPSHVVEFLQRVGIVDGVFVENREPGIVGDLARQRSFRLRKSKLESEVVEGGAEVVDAVPGDEAQAGGRRLDDLCPNDLLAALGIEFRPKSVRAFFSPGSPFRFEALQMVERPIEPPFVVEGHANGSMPKDRAVSGAV